MYTTAHLAICLDQMVAHPECGAATLGSLSSPLKKKERGGGWGACHCGQVFAYGGLKNIILKRTLLSVQTQIWSVWCVAAVDWGQAMEVGVYLNDTPGSFQVWSRSAVTGVRFVQFCHISHVKLESIAIGWSRSNTCGGLNCSFYYRPTRRVVSDGL